VTFHVSNFGGCTARVVAEDIIAYTQLRLAEMTKNDQIEYTNSNHVTNWLDQLEQDGKNKKSESGQFHGTIEGDEGEGGQSGSKSMANQQKDGRGSFKGLAGLRISHADLLDSQDLEQDEGNSFIGGLGQTRVGEKNKDLSSAERYKRGITSQLGNSLKFKSEQFFAYSKRYPLYNNFQQHDKDKSFGRSNQESANSRQLHGEPGQNDGDDDTVTKGRSNEQNSPDSSARPRVGSLSQNRKFNLGLNASATIEEH